MLNGGAWKLIVGEHHWEALPFDFVASAQLSKDSGHNFLI
jgi:hypothetical protein